MSRDSAMTNMVVLYGCAPPILDEPSRAPDWWDPSMYPWFAPAAPPVPPSPPAPPAHARAEVIAGVAKLLPKLREKLNEQAKAKVMLDADEVAALVWLEGLAAGYAGAN